MCVQEWHRSAWSDFLLTVLVFFSGVASLDAEAQTGRRMESANSRFLTLISENDNYTPARQDRHYTNGLFLSYGLAKGQQAPWLNWLGNLTPLADRIKDREYNIALGQNLYTPEAFSSPEAMPDDRPFAGWLYGELSVTTHSPGIEEHLAVNFGIAGPAAQGRATQKLLHNVTGDPEPLGWRNQLENEPALLLRYRRSWFTPLVKNQPVNLDLVYRAGLTAGNVVTEAGIGSMLRLGSALFERDIPQRLQPGLSGNGTRFDVRPGRFDWFIFAGVQGRIIAHNMFLDGNTFADSLSVDRKLLGWDTSTGISFSLGQLSHPVMFSFSFIWRGKEFDGQDKLDKFASAQLSVQF